MTVHNLAIPMYPVATKPPRTGKYFIYSLRGGYNVSSWAQETGFACPEVTHWGFLPKSAPSVTPPTDQDSPLAARS